MPAPEPTNLKAKIRHLPQEPGVYMMKDRLGSILYVGKAKNLRKRVASYFQSTQRLRAERPKIALMMEMVHDLEVITVNHENEALLLEGRLIKEWKPRYNTLFTDDKQFILLRVDIEQPLPRFRMVRFRGDERSLYYGPFVHSQLLRRTLAELRSRYGILLSDSQPQRLEDGRWRLYDDARAEIYGHSNEVTEAEYRERVDAACVFLDGKSREWVTDVEDEMKQAAEAMEYERAGELRDLLKALRHTIEKTRKFVRSPMRAQRHEQAVMQLGEALGMKEAPWTMECFDISHISGSFCVASMVRFVEGKPDRSSYRRYRIRSFVGNDDYRAMEEVVGRRYERLKKEGRPFPHLVVIDGGMGQVAAARKAFLLSDIDPPALIGLAKREETIFFSDQREPLQLPNNHEARLLLQRIRDEAHRFANTYNAELRRARIRESVLDDFKGLGSKKRENLLNHFKTLNAIRKAPISELVKIPGIGPKTAEDLKAFLDRTPDS